MSILIVAPGHGHDDFIVCQKHNIEPFCPVGDDGCYLPSVGLEGYL